MEIENQLEKQTEKKKAGYIKKSLSALCISIAIVGGGFGAFKGCSHLKRESYKRDIFYAHTYGYAGFIEDEYVTFEKGLSPWAQLRVERPDGRTTIYNTINQEGRNLNVEAVYVINRNELEKKIDLESEKGRLEILSIRQKEFYEYLAKIYEIKYSEKGKKD